MSLERRVILVTRQPERAEEMVGEIERRGGRAVVIPMIDVGPPSSWGACDAAIARLATFTAIAFASVSSVHAFLGRLRETGAGSDALPRLRVWAVGGKTADALRAEGVEPDRVAEEFSAAGLLAALGTTLRGASVLLPRGDIAREELARGLAGAGAEVTAVTVYRTGRPGEAPDLRRRVRAGEFDAIAFASPSAVGNFAELCGVSNAAPLPARTKCAAIGTTTAEALRAFGMAAEIIARESTGIGLVRSIDEYFS
jgi:uroporphyrinogen III methyltransferase / synthase